MKQKHGITAFGNSYLQLMALASIVFFLAFTAGIINGLSAHQEDLTASLIDRVLSDIEQAYEVKNIFAFMDLVDERYEGYLQFKEAVQDVFLSGKRLQLYFVFDTYLTEADKISVKLHWFKKTSDSSGDLVKTKGFSEFNFSQTSDGLKLLSVREDNPFY